MKKLTTALRLLKAKLLKRLHLPTSIWVYKIGIFVLTARRDLLLKEILALTQKLK